MFWLFGQIWLWRIVSFALGALCAWLVLRPRGKPKTETPPEPAFDHEEPPPHATEQTQFIPAAHYDEHRFPAAEPDDDPGEPEGHREGHLPMPPQRGPEAEDWPAEEEPAWPPADEPEVTREWPPAPHQPGRSG